MTVPYRAFYYVLPANKCAVGRDALILPRRNLADCNKRCKPFVGDDAWAIPHNSKCRYGERGAASAGAVLKPQGGNCAVLPLHRPACRALSNPPHLKLCRPLKFPSSQKAYARAFRARHMLFLLSHYKLIPPAPSDNNTPPTNPRRPHSFSCPGSGHTRAENRYTPCCLPL